MYVPSTHAAQVVNPEEFPNRPAAHDVHEGAARAEEKNPGLQAVQLEAPGWSWKRPGSHFKHRVVAVTFEN